MKLFILFIAVIITSVAFTQEGKIEVSSFTSTSLNQNITTTIYTPPNYSPIAEPYRVYIFLHGAAGSVSWDYAGIMKPILDKLITNGDIDPIIVVFPVVKFKTVYGKAIPYDLHWFTDSERNGKYASVITKDLLEWLPSQFNVTSSREERGVGGFSMGAASSIYLAIRNSNKFIACVSHDGSVSIRCNYFYIPYILNQTPGPPYEYSIDNGWDSAYIFSLAAAFSPNFTNPNMPEWYMDFALDSQGNVIDSVFYNKWIVNYDPATIIQNPFIYNNDIEIYFDATSSEGKQDNDLLHNELLCIGFPHTYKKINGAHQLYPENLETGLRFIDAAMDKATKQAMIKHDIQIKPYPDQVTSINILTGNKFQPKMQVKNIGADTQSDFMITCKIANNGSNLFSDSVFIDSLKSHESIVVSFQEWRPNEISNYQLTVISELSRDENKLNDTLETSLSFSFMVDDFESGFNNWTSGGDWGITNQKPNRGKFCMEESPFLNYESNEDAWVMYNSSFNFSELDGAYISFWSRRLLQNGNDYCYIEVSPDNGQTWDQLEKSYSGFQETWAEEVLSLKKYCGSGFDNVKIRFHFVSDSEHEKPMAGWFLDDISVYPILNEHDLVIASSPDFSENWTALANMTPTAVVRNLGKSEELSALINCQIEKNGIILFSNNKTVDELQSIQSEQVIFNRCSFPEAGIYHADFTTTASNDENRSNDTLKSQFQISNLLDDFEAEFALSNWINNMKWGLTTSRAKSGKASLSCSPQGSYEKNMDNSIEYKFSFDLSQVQAAHISYWTQYFIETNDDFGYVQVSTDSGKSWKHLGGAYTGFQASWKQDGRSLTQFCGSGFNNVRIRFRFVSDSTQVAPFIGWLLDDVAIYPTEWQTDISNGRKNDLPTQFNLFSNYPNPFNAHTIIRYQIPYASYVKLQIYNLLGQELITLLDQYQQPGDYKINWNGLDAFGRPVPTGIYIIKMEAGSFSKANKILLLK